MNRYGWIPLGRMSPVPRNRVVARRLNRRGAALFVLLIVPPLSAMTAAGQPSPHPVDEEPAAPPYWELEEERERERQRRLEILEEAQGNPAPPDDGGFGTFPDDA